MEHRVLTTPTAHTPDVRRALASIEIGIQILATRPGRIKDRLTEAFQGALFAIDPDDLSAPGVSGEARVWWENVVATMSSAPEGPDGPFRDAIEQLSEEEASDIAQLIVAVGLMLTVALENLGES
jgi:hypothetical protein